MTVQDIISTAMKRVGALAAGEAPTPEESADVFAYLNRMVDSWQTERLTVYTVTRTIWTIAANYADYTLGLTGYIPVARPVYVQRVKIIDTAQTPDLEIDLGPLLTEAEYVAIPTKALTAAQPSYAYYNPTFPLGTITFYPVPTSTTLQGVLYAPASVTQFASISTTVVLPPGYEAALVDTLATMIAPDFGRPVTDELRRQADHSKSVIKIANYRPILLSIDPALTGGGGAGWNINTDHSTRVA